MQSLIIDATENSPKVILDYEKSFIELEGKSYPENSFEFYGPILQWLETYLKENTKKQTTMNIKLSYFNSSTSQILFDLFDVLVDSRHENLDINWYYNSDKQTDLESYEEYSDEFEDLQIKAVPF